MAKIFSIICLQIEERYFEVYVRYGWRGTFHVGLNTLSALSGGTHFLLLRLVRYIFPQPPTDLGRVNIHHKGHGTRTFSSFLLLTFTTRASPNGMSLLHTTRLES